MQSKDFVAVNDLAIQFGVHKSNAHKWLLRQGFKFIKVRDIRSHQQVSALTASDAARAIELRSDLGFPVSEALPTQSENLRSVDSGSNTPSIPPAKVEKDVKVSLEQRAQVLAEMKSAVARLSDLLDLLQA